MGVEHGDFAVEELLDVPAAGSDQFATGVAYRAVEVSLRSRAGRDARDEQ
jgi:hypothetical protein